MIGSTSMIFSFRMILAVKLCKPMN